MNDKVDKDLVQSPEASAETRLSETNVGSYLAGKVMLELNALLEPQAD